MYKISTNLIEISRIFKVAIDIEVRGIYLNNLVIVGNTDTCNDHGQWAPSKGSDFAATSH